MKIIVFLKVEEIEARKARIVTTTYKIKMSPRHHKKLVHIAAAVQYIKSKSSELFHFIEVLGKIPLDWNIIMIISTYKKADNNELNKYREICVILCSMKIFRSICVANKELFRIEEINCNKTKYTCIDRGYWDINLRRIELPNTNLEAIISKKETETEYV